MLALFAMDRERGEPAPPREQLDAVALSPEDAAELERRRAMRARGRHGAAARRPHPLAACTSARRTCARCSGRARCRRRRSTARRPSGSSSYDEDRVLLDSAVKGSDGFFTTFFVCPYSKYIARWAARRGLTPEPGHDRLRSRVGVLAAAAFATGERSGLVAGAVLLQFAFTLDCVDGQLARYTRQFSKLGAWLDSIFDRTKEYVVFAGLAIGASRTGDPVWLLAGAALTLQTARHAIDFSYPGLAAPGDRRARRSRRSRTPLDGPRRRLARLAQPVDAEEADSLPAPPPPPRRARRLRGAWRGCGARSTAFRRCAGSRRSSPSRSASASR